jgi:hypothetical protein
MWWSDLETADGLLEEKSDGAPVGMGRDSVGGFIQGVGRGQRGIVHQLEIVKVRSRSRMLRCEGGMR